MNKDLISIIVPVYNVEKFLSQCIESIINQTYHNLEIILINDGSTDDSGKICDEYAMKDKRIKVIHQENSGVSNARNRGLDVASGEYIAFVDADDWIAEDMYEYMLKKAKKSNAEIVKCLQTIVYSNQNIQDNLIQNEILIDMKKDRTRMISQVIVNGKMPSFSLMLIKKDVIDNLRFDTELIIGEDLLFVMNLYLSVHSMIWCDKYFYYYRIHENSATNSAEKNKKMLLNLLKLYAKIKNLFINKNIYDSELKEGLGNYIFFRLYMRLAKDSVYQKSGKVIDDICSNKEMEEILKVVNLDKFSFFGKRFYDAIKNKNDVRFYWLSVIYVTLKSFR